MVCLGPHVGFPYGLWNEDTWSDREGGKCVKAVQQPPIPDEDGAVVVLVLLL